jgi:hypothetical protein
MNTGLIGCRDSLLGFNLTSNYDRPDGMYILMGLPPTRLIAADFVQGSYAALEKTLKCVRKTYPETVDTLKKWIDWASGIVPSTDSVGDYLRTKGLQVHRPIQDFFCHFHRNIIHKMPTIRTKCTVSANISRVRAGNIFDIFASQTFITMYFAQDRAWLGTANQ